MHVDIDNINGFANSALAAENSNFRALYPKLPRASAVDAFQAEAGAVTIESLGAFWQSPTVTERLVQEHGLDLGDVMDAVLSTRGSVVPFSVDLFWPMSACKNVPPCHVSMPLLSEREDGHGVVAIAIAGVSPSESERAALAAFYSLREVAVVSVRPEALRKYLQRLGPINFEPRERKVWSLPPTNGRMVHLRLRGFRTPGDDEPEQRLLWRQIDPRITSTNSAIPVYVSKKLVTFAVPDGTDSMARGAITSELAAKGGGRSARFVFAPPDEIAVMLQGVEIDRLQRISSRQADRVPGSAGETTGGAVEEVSSRAIESQVGDPGVMLAQTIMATAVHLNASDIVIEGSETKLWVRYRVHGTWQSDPTEYPGAAGEAVIGRLKSLAGMEGAKRRRPQDGTIAIRLTDSKRDFLFRVTAVRHVKGEEITMRLQPNDEVPPLIKLAGMTESLDAFLRQRVMARDNGLFIVSGPTGSGKTTTLHAMISAINRQTKRVIALENPVERVIAGVSHVEIFEDLENPDSPNALTWADGVRNALRRAPDVILIGEIRDEATARAALDGATTGHLTLGTLHSKSSMDVGQRLYSLGGDPGLFVDAFLGAMAQRLVKVACPVCTERAKPTRELCEMFSCDIEKLVGIDEVLVRAKAGGCSHCKGGVVGRQGLYELCSIESEHDREALAAAVYEEARGKVLQVQHALKNLLKEKGRKTLVEEALELVRTGAISLEEYARR